jgi:hypothetical protein
MNPDESMEAKVCSLVYDHTVRYCLSRYSWTFATIWTQLTYYQTRIRQQNETDDQYRQRLLNQGFFEYTYLYSFPNDYLRFVDLYDTSMVRLTARTSRKLPYLLEGNGILTDIGPTCYLKYVWDMPDSNNFSEVFLDYLIVELSYRFSTKFKDSSTSIQQLYMEREKALIEAKIDDSKQTMLGQISSYPLQEESWGAF